MGIVPLEFDLQSNPGRYGPDGAGRLINCYPEFAGGKAKNPFPIYPIAGLKSFATLTGGGASRGAISFDPYGYVVSGTRVFKVDSGGSATEVGTFPGSSPVFMARNRKSPDAQIALVSEGLRYILSADVVTSIADTDLPNANSVTAIAGYFVFSIEDGRFFITSIDEGTAIDALDFASDDANPDGLLVAEARAQEVIFFGSKSIEFWQHTGAAAFPFERQTATTLLNLGLLCPYSVRDLNDVKFFVASDGTVRMLDGYQPQRISTPSVERDIDKADKSTIHALAYSLRGEQNYVLSSPTWTWTYNGAAPQGQNWHERQSYGEDRWRGEVFVDINGTRCIGDFESGLLYEIDPDTYNEAGTHLVMTLHSAPMHAYPNQVGVDRCFLDTIAGRGLNSANEHLSDPKVMMRYSDDGGKSWSNERSASMGKIGEFGRRVKWERLGQTKQVGRIWEFSMSAAVIRGITGAAVDVEAVEP